MTEIQLRSLNIHTGPGESYKSTKLVEILRVVVPDISKVAGSSMCEKSKSGCFLWVQQFVVLHRAKDRNKTNGYIVLRFESCCGCYGTPVCFADQITGTSFRKEQC